MYICYNLIFISMKEILIDLCACRMLDYAQNDLYHLLNSSFEGKIILEKYKYTKELDYGRLKDIVILHKIQEDKVNYR